MWGTFFKLQHFSVEHYLTFVRATSVDKVGGEMGYLTWASLFILHQQVQ